MTSTSSHQDVPEFAAGGIIPSEPGDHGDAIPAFLTGCDYTLLAASYAAEDDERRRIARRRPPHWEGED